MGVPLTKILADKRHRVYVTSRRARVSEVENVTFLQGYAHDLSFIKCALSGSHYDAIVDFMSYSTKEFQERYAIMLEAARQYIFISSARVFAECKGKISEDSPRLLDACRDEAYLATDEYALAKARQENLLRSSGRTNWTIIRPSITYNDYRLQMGAFDKEGWLYRALHGRSIVLSRDVADKLTAMTHGADLTRALANMIGQGSALGKAFNIATEKSYTWRQILPFYLDVLEEVTGSRPRVVEAEQSVKMRDGSRYQIMYARSLNRSFDASALKPYVDVSTFLDAKEGLRTALRNFLKAPRFDAINWRHEAWNDRECGERTPLSEIPSTGARIEYICYRYRLPLLYRAYRKAKRIIKR